VSAPTRIRLVDVAREAGVSKSIASRILNGYPALAVRPETRRRVLGAAERLHYEPHAAARGLRRAATGAIGLLIPNLTMPVYSRIIRGAVKRALERDVAVLLYEDESPLDSDRTFAQLVRTGRIDGMLVASALPDHPLVGSLLESRIPHVFLNRGVPGSGRNVTMDDTRASVAALDHLHSLGHRRVGLVAGPRGNDPAERRALGFRRHAAELGLELAPVADDGDFTEAGGARLTGELLRRHNGLTAITTGGLSQAVGALHAAWERGRVVPRELSVVSFDDLSLAEYLRPPLTTVRMPLDRLGAAGVDALVDQLIGGEPCDVVVETRPEVVVRASTASPST
jgi:LacI family transcriptional regulator, galactose operon repressor